MSIRRYAGRSRSRRSNPVGEWRRSNPREWRRNPTPLKPKQFKRRMEQLEKLGLGRARQRPPSPAASMREELKDLLVNADSSHANYVFDFWQARLAMLKLVNEEEPPERQMEGKLVDIIQKYAGKYFIDPYYCYLDEELQIDYYESLKHFIQLAANNPYFAAPWPVAQGAALHRITFIVPPERWDRSREGERHVWLGRIKGKTKLSNLRFGLYGYAHDHPRRADAPDAIRLLRGAYSGDPIGAERETEIPVELIYTDEKTMAPSDLIEYLTDMEENTVSAKFFVPKFHDPFMTFEDGKSWVIIHRDDKSAESRSLDDCGEGQHSSDSIILLSLREPIPGTHPQQYKALLKAEAVFPSGTIERNEYLDYRELEGSVGIINQLRAHHNSKPGTSGRPNDQTITDRSLHKYIIPLLEEPWVAHFSRPTHRGERVFWPTDLTPRQIEYLKDKNEYLFDTQKFYEKFKQLDYPHRIKEQLLDGLEFPISQVLETFAAMTPSMLRGRTMEERIVRTSIKRAAKAREQGNISDDLLSLLDAAEQRILGVERRGLEGMDVHAEPARDRMRDWLLGAGAEISYPEIYRILQSTDAGSYKKEHEGGAYDRQGRWYPNNWDTAVKSLAKKIERDDDDVAPLKRLGSKLLAAGFDRGLAESGVTLNINQLQQVIESKLADAKTKTMKAQGLIARFRSLREQRTLRSTSSIYFEPTWSTILSNLRRMSLKALESVAPLLREVILTTRIWAERDRSRTSGIAGFSQSFRGPTRLPVNIVELSVDHGTRHPFILNEEDITKILTDASQHFLPGLVPMYRAALISLRSKLADGVTLREENKLTAVAAKFLLAVKDKELAREVSNIVELPMKDIINVISAKRYNLTVRLTALDSLKKRINRGDKALRRKALFAIKQLLSRTKNKHLISKIFDTYAGHKSRYELLYFLAIERIEWLSDNQEFFIELLGMGLPSGEGRYGSYTKILPRNMYLLFRKFILEEPIDYLSLVIKLLFQIRFSIASRKEVGRLIELALGKIIDDPNLLITRDDLCDWYQYEHHTGGWGSSHTTHRDFTNQLKLTPKLLGQFRILRNITLTIDDRQARISELTGEELARFKRSGTIGERRIGQISAGARDFILRDHRAEARSNCFLDLAITIAQAMDKDDRAKMYGLIEPLIRRSMTRGGQKSRWYGEMARKLSL